MRGLHSATYARTVLPTRCRWAAPTCSIWGRTLTALTWDKTTFRPARRPGTQPRLHGVVMCRRGGPAAGACGGRVAGKFGSSPAGKAGGEKRTTGRNVATGTVPVSTYRLQL